MNLLDSWKIEQTEAAVRHEGAALSLGVNDFIRQVEDVEGACPATCRPSFVHLHHLPDRCAAAVTEHLLPVKHTQASCATQIHFYPSLSNATILVQTVKSNGL